MLRKFRNKLLLFNMVSLAVVVAASFAIIFFTQYMHLRSMDMDRLEAIPKDVFVSAMLAERRDTLGGTITAGPDGNVTIEPEGGAGGGGFLVTGGGLDSGGTGEKQKKKQSPLFIDKSGPELPLDYSKFFVLNRIADGAMYSFSLMDLDDNDYIIASNAVVAAAHAGKPVGDLRFAGSHWLYSYEMTADIGLPIGESNESMAFLNIDDTDSAMKRMLLNMIIIGACVLAGLFFISLIFSNRALKPTEEGMRRQRQFVADASHELKTPLAIIDANAEAALSEMEPAGEGLWIGRIADESARMRGLIDDLLFLARSEDAADIQVERLPVDLSVVAEEEIGRMEAVLFERGIALEFQKPVGSVVVRADPARIRQVMLILLDNAMKYTERGGRVTVSTGRTKKSGLFSVTNTGNGISQEDLPHVFERFFRADKSRSSVSRGGAANVSAGAGSGERGGAYARKGGYGLGLAIAKAITERSGGKIHAASSGGITVFTIEFPFV
jgi:signal transduction histidine kinase